MANITSAGTFYDEGKEPPPGYEDPRGDQAAPAEEEPAPETVPVPPPARASRQEWADHAVSRGADPGEVEGLTKAQLIGRFGSG